MSKRSRVRKQARQKTLLKAQKLRSNRSWNKFFSAILNGVLLGVAIVCMGYVGIMVGIYFAPISNGDTGIKAPVLSTPFSTSTAAALPARIIIPKIGVDASVEAVGLTASGNMGTPRTFHTVAWYDKGPNPGNPGTAVIVGHVDNGLGLAAVFYRLKELAPGDMIEVEDQNAIIHTFMVTDASVYDYDNAPLQKIFEGDGKTAALNLITCSGLWIPSARMYDKRLVVYAVLSHPIADTGGAIIGQRIDY